jgi:tRNA(Arg) A34 adenosine deaminase TadA
MCVATMYQAGIARLFYAADAADSGVFFGRLIAHDPKWARAMNNQELRKQVGLPITERSMASEQMMAADIVAVFEAFIERHT